MRTMSRRSRRAATGAGRFLSSGLARAARGCRWATQSTSDVRTRGLTCADLKGVSIVVSGSRHDAEDKLDLGSLSAEIPRGQCGADDHQLGTLVLTPSGSG